ncbi:MAG TPA: hypothetical protein VF571_15925 [Pyrinomonadaceae bacterium]
MTFGFSAITLNSEPQYETPCQVYFGSKMEIVKDKGSRLCPHCVDERGRPTGKEPITK